MITAHEPVVCGLSELNSHEPIWLCIFYRPRGLMARGTVELKAAHAVHCGLGYIHLGEEPFPYFHRSKACVFYV